MQAPNHGMIGICIRLHIPIMPKSRINISDLNHLCQAYYPAFKYYRVIAHNSGWICVVNLVYGTFSSPPLLVAVCRGVVIGVLLDLRVFMSFYVVHVVFVVICRLCRVFVGLYVESQVYSWLRIGPKRHTRISNLL